LDSVMNYPLRNALVKYIKGRLNAYALSCMFLSQQQNYPAPMYYCLMNLLSSHDIERIKTALAYEGDIGSLSREQQAGIYIDDSMDKIGEERSKLAVCLQMSLPGMPSVYYGDEMGLNGMKDPFNRRPFQNNPESLYFFYKRLIGIRQSSPALKVGYAGFASVGDDVVIILRTLLGGKDIFGEERKDEVCVCIANRSNEKKDVSFNLYEIQDGIAEEQIKLLKEVNAQTADCLITGRKVSVKDGNLSIEMFPLSAEILKLDITKDEQAIPSF
jgi:glycosidase